MLRSIIPVCDAHQLGMKTLALWAVPFAVACGADTEDNNVRTPYRSGEANLIGAEPGGETTNVDDCGDCGDVERECGKAAAADVVLDEDGNVVDVLCYKPDVDVELVPTDVTGTVNAGNDTVLVLDDEDDGVDVEGDVVIEGNNAVVWGDGPDTSIIAGTVDVEKNNAIIRGVRIQEDVTIEKNNTSLAFCVIEGDLIITGNNTTVAECTVFGEVRITGLNTILVGNEFEGTDEVGGYNLTCNDNVRFDDTNEDLALDDAELGGVVVCVDAEGPPDPQTDVQAESDAGTVSDLDAGDLDAGDSSETR
jgi:hypothetical protein